MAQADSRSLEEIRRDAELARAGLTATVDQLKSTVTDTAQDFRERYSPDAIKAEVSGYIKSRGEAMIDSVTDAIRNNPLQALAIGASIAVPLLRVVRTIPAPVLMVGAGLYLAGTKRGQDVARQANDAAMELAGEVGRRARDIGAEVGEAAAATRDYAADRYAAASEAVAVGTEQLKGKAAELGATISSTVDGLRHQANDAGDRISDEVSELSERGSRSAAEAVDSVRDSASTVRQAAASMRETAAEAAARLRQTASASVDAGRDAAAIARDRAADLAHRAARAGDRAGRTLMDTATQNPLLVAGIGLVLGGLIASALPRSRIEDRLVGGTARGLKERARDVAAQSVEGVKEAVSGAYQEVSRAAEQEGLTPDGVAGAAGDLGQRARKVAEAATGSFDRPSSHNKH
ncbi:late embryogenesis abundant protein [Rhodopseudomonas palustris]|uniref:Late embryogenesis abundant protein n=1 Tax=Rhodopseudomonas palustris (strain BisB18) TaxID=316056 RepID=Q20XL3_RHOPB